MGKTCAVIQCNAVSVSFHKIPSKGQTIPSWMRFLELVNAKWMWTPVKTMYVCSCHFESKYVSTDGPTTRVHKNGFPTLLNGVCLPEMMNEAMKYEIQSAFLDVKMSSPDCDNCSKLKDELNDKDAEIQFLKSKLEELKTNLSMCRSKLKSVNQTLFRQEMSKEKQNQQEIAKRAKLDDDIIIRELEQRISSVELLEIVKRAIIGKSKAPYCDLLKEFCFQLHYYSGKGYDMLRSRFNMYIPTIRSLSSWTEHVNAEPGFLIESLNYLQKVNKESTYKLYYAISVDEIHIRKQIIHKDDGFVGYVDYGGIVPLLDGEVAKVATAALFVYATAINGHHKLPVCYILTSGLKSSVLSCILERSITEMTNRNCQILSVTFDGLPSNFKSMEKLGANLNLSSPNFQPYFSLPSTTLKINLIPDFCHMIKLFRNLFKKYGVLKTFRGETIKWVHIHRLQKLQEKEGLKAASKLTARHVNFELEKMKTKLCVQVMSRSVSAALSFCRTLQIPGFDDSAPTEEFLLFMNRLFDILNSKKGCKNDKRPLQPEIMANINPFLDMMKFYLVTLKVNEGGKEILLIDSKRSTSPKGLVIAINSVQNIVNCMGADSSDLKYIPTYKLSQDKLEMFFATIRSRLGRNNNPNAIQLSQAVKSVLCMKAKCIVEGNCTIPENEEATRVCAFKNIASIFEEENECSFEENECSFEENECSFEEDEFPSEESMPDLSAFSGNVVGYIAGFVGSKLLPKLTCGSCIYNLFPDDDDLEKIKEDCILTLEKDNGGLFLPSYLLLSVCKMTEQFIRREESNGLKNMSKEIVTSCVVKNCEDVLFKSWKSTGQEKSCNHATDLFKAISAEYAKVRFHHAAKKTTLVLNPTSKRNFYTRRCVLEGV